MDITIQINGQAVTVDVSDEVYECIRESDRRTENLQHQKRRHWDMRELDEQLIATECSHIHIPTPEEILIRKKNFDEIMAVLDACTPTQRQRFLLYALEDMSFSEIALYCGCSKISVYESIAAVREKYKNYFK